MKNHYISIESKTSHMSLFDTFFSYINTEDTARSEIHQATEQRIFFYFHFSFIKYIKKIKYRVISQYEFSKEQSSQQREIFFRSVFVVASS